MLCQRRPRSPRCDAALPSSYRRRCCLLPAAKAPTLCQLVNLFSALPRRLHSQQCP